jgi:alpha-tubulin suppressor-like RCC1 family protein
VNRVALALCALLFAACDPKISALTIDAGAQDASDLACDENPCLNSGVCQLTEEGFHCACEPGFEGDLCEIDVNDCDPNPCKNDGQCSDRVASYSCACAPGFTGVDCSTNIDECADAPCGNGGECTDVVNGYQCDCAAGYSGSRCEVNVDDCITLPCENGGECQDEVNGFTCNCIEGNTGPTCSSSVEVCSAGLCQHGGTCMDTDEGFECTCAPGYNGANCENDIDDCASTPCVQGNCVDGVNGYNCECPAGYEGVNCEYEIDPCNTNPCQNGGECNREGDTFFVCVCKDGWNGTRCEHNVDECSASPCANGGVCTNGTDGFTCECTGGFTGPTCNNEQDECPDTNPCGNGVCVNGDGGYKCDCNAGFIGATCEVNVDDCEPDPCDNGACTDAENGYECGCETGYEGPECQGDIDDCLDEPCQNGGTCHDQLDGFECTCIDRWAGDTCTECEQGFEIVGGACERTCDSSPKDCGENGTCAIELGETVCDCEDDYFGLLCDSFSGTCSQGICGANGACEPTSPDTFKCECEPGYVGRNCETLDECVLAIANNETPCTNDGECVDGDNEYTCTCTNGWTGDDCSLVDECEVAVAEGLMPCSDHGTCVDGDAAFSCTCDAGWTEADCSEVDDCVDHECENGGECVDGDGAYTCDCADDYIGTRCETLEDDCVGNPCLNGGVCSNVGTSYECDCARTGYSGTNCQDDLDECDDVQADVCDTGTCTNLGNGIGYGCHCPDGTLDVAGDGKNCAMALSLAAGPLNTCAISAAGSLHCWGDNTHAQLGQGTTGNPGTAMTERAPTRVGTGTDWTKVSVGGRHVCGLRGTRLYCWGDNANRQGGVKADQQQLTPTEVRPDLSWTDVSAGDSHTCALAGSDLYCWGSSADGQSGVATVGTNVDAPKQIAGTWTDISAGGDHTCAINSANELRCWGRNDVGQVAAAPSPSVTAAAAQAIPVPGNAGTWTSVEAGPSHSCAVAGTQTYCWGEGSRGSLGHGVDTDSATPQAVTSAETLDLLATGTDFSCGVVTETSGFQIYCWGSNDSSLLLTGDTQVNVATLVTTSNMPIWTAYAVGARHICAIEGGLVECWGSNVDGALGNGAPSATIVAVPTGVKSQLVGHSSTDYCEPNPCRNGGVCSEVNNSYSCDCAGTGFTGTTCTTASDECAMPTICGQGTCRDRLDDDGYSCTCPDGSIDLDQTGTTCVGVAQISAGFNHTCVITSSQTLHCWGSNRYGQFGLGQTGTTAYYPDENSQTIRTPLRLRTVTGVVGAVTGWNKVAVGQNHTCAVRSTGGATEQLYCWGDNASSQVGGDTSPQTYAASPRLLDNTRTWTALSAGDSHTCGIASGALYCWGNNNRGQLGDGTTANHNFSLGTAVSVPAGSSSWTSVAGGTGHTCATTNTQTTYCWGKNTGVPASTITGQIGNGAPDGTALVPDPTRVTLLDPQGFTAVATDTTHSCGLSGTSTYCWGQGNLGAVGDGMNTNRTIPTLVSGGRTFSRLSLGSNFSCGTVAIPATTPQAYEAFCWGSNTKNVLLTGGGNVNVPTAVMTTRPWRVFEVGSTHICGVDNTDGRLYCWGDNNVEDGSIGGKLGFLPAGQLGNSVIGAVKAAPANHAAP